MNINPSYMKLSKTFKTEFPCSSESKQKMERLIKRNERKARRDEIGVFELHSKGSFI